MPLEKVNRACLALRAKRLLCEATRPMVYSCFVLLADSVGFLLWQGSVPRLTLVLTLFLEGGLGLLVGVAIALSSTPSVARVGEVLVGTSPWSREGEDRARRTGARWMLVSVFLILIGFVVSAV